MKYQAYITELKSSVRKFKNSGHKFDSLTQQMRALVKLKQGQQKISKLKHREDKKQKWEDRREYKKYMMYSEKIKHVYTSNL